MKKLHTNYGVHPAPETLALFLRGELPPLRRLRWHWHISSCTCCESELRGLRAALEELRSEAAAQTLRGFEGITSWGRLEHEMVGNIVVGVAAARCIENIGRKRRFIPAAAMTVGLCVLFAAGWATHIPDSQTKRLFAALWQGWRGHATLQVGSIVETTPNGIAVRSQGVTLTMMHPKSALLSLSGSSAVEARFIDEDSGQVTITDVYGQ